MKTENELKELKEKFEALQTELEGLSEEELELVAGGCPKCIRGTHVFKPEK